MLGLGLYVKDAFVMATTTEVVFNPAEETQTLTLH